MENEELRKLKEKEDRKRYRKKQWQDIKWSAEEILLNFLLKFAQFALPTLVSIATSVVTIAILRKIVG